MTSDKKEFNFAGIKVTPTLFTIALLSIAFSLTINFFQLYQNQTFYSDSSMKNMQVEIQTLTENNEILQKDNSIKIDEIKKLNDQITLKTQEITGLNNEIANKNRVITELNNEIANKNQEINRLNIFYVRTEGSIELINENYIDYHPYKIIFAPISGDENVYYSEINAKFYSLLLKNNINYKVTIYYKSIPGLEKVIDYSSEIKSNDGTTIFRSFP